MEEVLIKKFGEVYNERQSYAVWSAYERTRAHNKAKPYIKRLSSKFLITNILWICVETIEEHGKKRVENYTDANGGWYFSHQKPKNSLLLVSKRAD